MCVREHTFACAFTISHGVHITYWRPFPINVRTMCGWRCVPFCRERPSVSVSLDTPGVEPYFSNAIWPLAFAASNSISANVVSIINIKYMRSRLAESVTSASVCVTRVFWVVLGRPMFTILRMTYRYDMGGVV